MEMSDSTRKRRTRTLRIMMALCVVALITIGSTANAFGALIPGTGPRVLDPTLLAQSISAKALTDHECNDAEWHFVINQIDSEANAPASITVKWANGATETVPLDKFTGGVAHYTTTSNLDSQVTSATASIYDGWDGQFNLSHGPCGTSDETSTPTNTPTNTPVPPTQYRRRTRQYRRRTHPPTRQPILRCRRQNTNKYPNEHADQDADARSRNVDSDQDAD